MHVDHILHRTREKALSQRPKLFRRIGGEKLKTRLRSAFYVLLLRRHQWFNNELSGHSFRSGISGIDDRDVLGCDAPQQRLN